MLSQDAPLSVQWENRLMGNALPLPFSNPRSYSIYLNEDCVYRFERLNQLEWILNVEECALFRELLCGGWKEPSRFSKGCAGLFLCLALFAFVWVEIPVRCMSSWFRAISSWIHRDRFKMQAGKVSAQK
jgi:hypothetical protein